MAEYNNNNTNNNYNNQNRVTTSGLTFFDDNGIMLRLGYLDDSLSLVMGQPSISENGKKKYPQEMRHPFMITIERATALYNVIVPKVIDALDKGEDYSGGVFLNKSKNAIFEIRVESGDVLLVYYKNIGEDRTPGETYVFKCQRTQIIEAYNPDGTAFEQNSVEGVFAVFCKYLECGVYDLHNSAAHSFRKGNSYTINAIFNYLKSIAAKLGVTMEYSKPSTVPSGFVDVPDNGPDEVPFIPSEPVQTSMDGLLN